MIADEKVDEGERRDEGKTSGYGAEQAFKGQKGILPVHHAHPYFTYFVKQELQYVNLFYCF